jgi:bacterial/archaeal transporter family-2 protein
MNLKQLLPYIFAIMAGIFTTLESGINGHIGRIVTPKVATIYSLFIGCLVMFIAAIFRGGLGHMKKLLNLPSNLLFAGALGGFFGAMIIYFVAKTIPRLGVTVTLTLVVAAQILSGLYFDIVVSKQHIDLYKIIGAFAVIAGVYFITLKS